jgi:hypothetical protein
MTIPDHPEQSTRALAEMIAKFRTPPGLSWDDLANDIETAIHSRMEWVLAEVGRPGASETEVVAQELAVSYGPGPIIDWDTHSPEMRAYLMAKANTILAALNIHQILKEVTGDLPGAKT